MGLADRDYMRERYRDRQGLPSEATVWKDSRARVELRGDYLTGRWRTRIRRHFAVRRRLISATLTGIACLLLVADFKNRDWLENRLAASSLEC